MSTSRKHEDFTAENFGRLLKEKQFAHRTYAWTIRTSGRDDDADDEDDA